MSSAQWIETKVKPLSANQMHYSAKVDTTAYRNYRKELIRRLPDIEIPDGLLRIRILACVSSKLSDLDNVVKPFLDVLQKRYPFNDRNVYRIVCEKRIVKKGEESLIFAIDEWKPAPLEIQESLIITV